MLEPFTTSTSNDKLEVFFYWSWCWVLWILITFCLLKVYVSDMTELFTWTCSRCNGLTKVMFRLLTLVWVHMWRTLAQHLVDFWTGIWSYRADIWCPALLRGACIHFVFSEILDITLMFAYAVTMVSFLHLGICWSCSGSKFYCYCL